MHLSDVDKFEESPVWKDIVEVLGEVRHGILNIDFLAADPANVAEIARMQGRVAEIDFILRQPDAIRAEIEAEEKPEKGKEGN